MNLIPQGGNDRVYTPPDLAARIVDHFNPTGFILEPCRGQRAFYNQLLTRSTPALHWCELDEDRDFFKWAEILKHAPHLHGTKGYDWIVTNPPFSKFKDFLTHSLDLSLNVLFLCSINHAIALKARNKIVADKGFGVREILYVDTPPKPWPQSGFQIGCVHWQHGYEGLTEIGKL